MTTIATILRREREKQKIEIDEIAKALNIRRKYLIALEEERYSDIPGKAYINGYIKLYAKFLNISIDCHNIAENYDDYEFVDQYSNDNNQHQEERRDIGLNSGKRFTKPAGYIVAASFLILICIMFFWNKRYESISAIDKIYVMLESDN